MKIKGTNWTTPKRNIIAGMNSLRQCLASGSNGKLIKAWNSECEFPITISNPTDDLRNWKFSFGTMSTENEILASDATDFKKNLSLKYKTCYGTKKAVDQYYETGKLSKGNFKSVGRSHIVKREDAIKFWIENNNSKYALNFITKKEDEKGWFDFFSLENGWAQKLPKKFKRKVWVVQLLDDDVKTKTPVLVHIIAVLAYPLKWIPKKRVLNMDEYKNITFSVGDVIHGFSVEFQIPKKFSF